ncbi:MAG: pentapeptide repeat-containing protein, partial [Candidatus Thermoplasmatota archaeon]|nr:pentapeptide repeat-containing protein [Candidatus Thermoplasmatota archaeon]
MVMSGGGQGDPRDDESVAEQAVVVDYSFQNHSAALLRKGRHAGSNFRRTIFDRADLTEGDFTNCDFRR